MKKYEYIKAASRAHTHLNIFAAVVAILEGGTIHGLNKAADRIIAICKTEQQRQLKLYDAAVAKAQEDEA